MLRKNIKNCTELRLQSLIYTFMVFVVSFALISCEKEEPKDDGNEDDSQSSIVTASDLAGKWTLVTDNVLYSKENSKKEDETIHYKGGSAPYYKLYNVSVSEEGVISMVEVSTSGSAIGSAKAFLLDGTDLVTVNGNKTAGVIVNYDPSHSWDNLRIEWNKDYSPTNFGAPVISTYMLRKK